MNVGARRQVVSVLVKVLKVWVGLLSVLGF